MAWKRLSAALLTVIGRKRLPTPFLARRRHVAPVGCGDEPADEVGQAVVAHGVEHRRPQLRDAPREWVAGTAGVALHEPAAGVATVWTVW